MPINPKDFVKTKLELVAPTVHLNGSSGGSLFEAYIEAIDALNKARDIMIDTSPHLRDYYVSSDPNAFNKARDQHIERQGKIRMVIDELTELAANVQDQMDARKR